MNNTSNRRNRPQATGARRCVRNAFLAVVALLPSVGFPEPFDYQIDDEHVTLGFLVEHVGYAKVLGQFLDIEGSYRFDEETGELSNVRVVVAADSVFSNHQGRDEHLRSDDFLDARTYAEIVFSADRAERNPDGTFIVRGTLNLLGVVRPLELTATWNRSADYPFGNTYVMGVSARAELSRSEFGMDYALDGELVGDRVEILIELEAQRR